MGFVKILIAHGDGKRLPCIGGMDRSPTISDVAHRAGVSVATASRTLHGVRPVGEALRDQVVAAARELGYSPNPHAPAPAQSSDASVGVIVHDVTDPYFSEIVRGMLQASAQTERLVLICNTYRDRERELAYVAHFRAQRVKALVLAGSGLEDREFGARMATQIHAFEATGGRAVLIGRHYAPGDSVIPDNVGGAREMAGTLVRLWHRRIGGSSGPASLTTTHDRLFGVRLGLGDLGLELDAAAMVTGDFTRAGGEAAGSKPLVTPPRLTSFHPANDVLLNCALIVL